MGRTIKAIRKANQTTLKLSAEIQQRVFLLSSRFYV